MSSEQLSLVDRNGKLGGDIRFRETEGFVERLAKLCENPRIKLGAKRDSVARIAFRLGVAQLEEMQREGLL